jgi:hypothetical protein
MHRSASSKIVISVSGAWLLQRCRTNSFGRLDKTAAWLKSGVTKMLPNFTHGTYAKNKWYDIFKKKQSKNIDKKSATCHFSNYSGPAAILLFKTLLNDNG